MRWVVAPSKVHHFVAGHYAAAYPIAQLFAAPGLAEKRADVRFHAVLDDDARPEWQGQIDQHLFGGAPAINEVVFCTAIAASFRGVHPIGGRAPGS